MSQPTTYCYWVICDKFCLEIDEWSALITMLGVLVAIFLPLYQRRHDRIDRQTAEAEKLAKTRQLFHAFEGECALLSSYCIPGVPRASLNRSLMSLNQQLDWLEKLDLQEFPDAATLRIYFLLQADFARLRSHTTTLRTIQLHIREDQLVAERIKLDFDCSESHAKSIAECFLLQEKHLIDCFEFRVTNAWHSTRAKLARRKLTQPRVGITSTNEH